jgi:hypothetical protein
MNKTSGIKAMRVGPEEAIDLIEFFKKDRPKEDSVDFVLQQLKQLLAYSEHIYDADVSKRHPLYDN